MREGFHRDNDILLLNTLSDYFPSKLTLWLGWSLYKRSNIIDQQNSFFFKLRMWHGIKIKKLHGNTWRVWWVNRSNMKLFAEKHHYMYIFYYWVYDLIFSYFNVLFINFVTLICKKRSQPFGCLIATLMWKPQQWTDTCLSKDSICKWTAIYRMHAVTVANQLSIVN